MNSKCVDVFQKVDKTPIEVLLNIDTEGRTTAKKLYMFLQLDTSNYARWAKKEIIKNEYAEENVDYWAFVINDEWGGQATTDYKLTASFAKKLAMKSHSERGEQARNYFILVEEKLKQIALKATDILRKDQIPIVTYDILTVWEELRDSIENRVATDSMIEASCRGILPLSYEELEERKEATVLEEIGPEPNIGDYVPLKFIRYYQAGPKPIGTGLPLDAPYREVPDLKINLQVLEESLKILQVTA